MPSPSSSVPLDASPVHEIVAGPLGAKLDQEVQTLAGQGFSGTLLAAKDGNVLLEKAYGFSDFANKQPMAIQTVLDTASLTKQFTGAAILKLQMAGKLRTTDTLAAFFNDVPPDKAAITLHQLLTHSAGFAQDYGKLEDKIGRDEAIRLYFTQPLLFQPGSRFEYSNVGYTVLAAIIEKNSGQSYEEYLRDQLFLPSGMTSTGYRLPGWDKEQVAHYPPSGDAKALEIDSLLDRPGPYWHMIGAGGILTTVDDLYKWYKALQGDTVLDEVSKEQLFGKQIEYQGPGGTVYYGYGWGIMHTPRGTTMIGHNGGDSWGTSSDFRWFPDENAVLIVLSNSFLQGDLAATPAANAIEKVLFGT